MKKIFLLFVLASLILTGCDDDKEPGNNGKVQLLETISYDGVLLYEYEYDSENRITKITDYYDGNGTAIFATTTFEYSGDNMSMVYTNARIPQDNNIVTYTKNGNKIIVNVSFSDADRSEITTGIIDINTENYPVKNVLNQREATYTRTYGYQNGNLVKATYLREEEWVAAISSTSLFTHDNKKSPFYYCKTPKYHLVDYLRGGFYIPIGIKNNVTSTELDNSRVQFTLTYDGDFLKSVTDGRGSIMTFTYIIK